MAQYGLGNFLYEFVADGKTANFKFWDAEDVTNTAEVSVSEKDFPEGVKDADSRQVADVAFAQCSKVLNDKRDARLKKEAVAELDEKTAEEARQREAEAEFHANSSDVKVQPAQVDKDGTNVFNVPNENSNANSSSAKK